MESEETNNNKREKQPSYMNLEGLYDFIDHMEALLDKLTSKANQLPKVDEKGNSECPFAEELYANKEEALTEVAKESKKLEQYLDRVEQEIKRCRKNLDLIQLDRASLNLDEARKQYDAAEKTQQQELDKFIYLKKRLTDLKTRKNKLFKTAQDKRHTWPIGKPKQNDHCNPEAILDSVLASRSNSVQDRLPRRPAFNSELNSLLDLGPLS